MQVFMRILIFNWRDTKHSWAGGGEIYVFEQAKRWVKNGHAVTLFCGEDFEKKLPPFEIIDGIKIYRKGGRYSLYFWAIWYYFTKLKKNADIIVDVENGIPFFTPLFSQLPKTCFVHHVHRKQFFYELPFPVNFLGYSIETYIFPLIYKHTPIIAVSKTTRNDLIEIGIPRKNIYIVLNGINKYSNKTINYKKFINPTILYLGRIKKYKRVDLLVSIFPQIVKKIPQARLILAGWGTEASNVANLVMVSSLRRKISLLGPVSDTEKKSLLSKSWVFVNPSIGEGWSIAVIEANYYGTPAVSFNVPGLRESIQTGKTGLLAKDEKDITDKICLILSNKNLRIRMNKEAMQWAQKFDWNASATKSLILLEKVIKNHYVR